LKENREDVELEVEKRQRSIRWETTLAIERDCFFLPSKEYSYITTLYYAHAKYSF